MVPPAPYSLGGSFVARSRSGRGTDLLPRKRWTLTTSVTARPWVSPRLSDPSFAFCKVEG